MAAHVGRGVFLIFSVSDEICRKIWQEMSYPLRRMPLMQSIRVARQLLF